MPELPEVEQFRKFLTATCLNQTVKSVTVKNPMVLDQVTAADFSLNLTGTSIENIVRHGKYVFIQASGIWLTLHFGMSGRLFFFSSAHESPSHERVRITFTTGNYLSYDCQRMFGRIGLTDTIDSFLRRKKLGPDALEVALDIFLTNFSTHRGFLKSALMNQQLIAGIGNLYADEILFQTNLHPATKLEHLTNDHLEAIYKRMKEILTTALAVDADFKKYPSSYLLCHREKGAKCPRDHTELQQIKITGRTAYYCPKHQHLPSTMD